MIHTVTSDRELAQCQIQGIHNVIGLICGKLPLSITLNEDYSQYGVAVKTCFVRVLCTFVFLVYISILFSISF